MFYICRSKNQKGKKVTEREDIKFDKKKAPSKEISKKKRPVDATKATTRSTAATCIETTSETDAGKIDDDNTLLSIEGDENVPLNPIEQVTDEADECTLSLRKYVYNVSYLCMYVLPMYIFL